MAIVVETFLTCDNCGNTFGVDNRGRTGKEQRQSAKGNGWVYSAGKDLCGDCRPKKIKFFNKKSKSFDK